jgi:MSHA biogenesis protein MshP
MKAKTPQQGFAAIAAVFLVVGLAALGAFMVSLSSTQQLTAAQDLQGTQAYWAARAGLEWGVTSVNASSACPASPTTLTPPGGFSVVVRCSSQAYTEGATAFTIFQILSVTSSGTTGSIGFIERSVSASLER